MFLDHTKIGPKSTPNLKSSPIWSNPLQVKKNLPLHWIALPLNIDKTLATRSVMGRVPLVFQF